MDTNATDICQKAEYIFNITEHEDAYGFLYGTFDVILITVILPVISVIGILGNSAFLYTIIRIEDLRKATVTIYLGNLAICDILLLIFVTGWYIATYISSPVNGAFPVTSALGCSIWQLTTHYWYLGSLSFITLITIERYLAICKPVQHRNFGGKRLTLKLVIAVWVISLVFTLSAVPQFSKSVFHCIFWPDSEEFKDLPLTFNDCNPESEAANLYVHLFHLVTLLISMVVNFVLFVRIIIALRGFSKRSSRAENVTKQVTRTLVANGIIFFICQVPERIFSLDEIFDDVGGVDLLTSRYTEALVLLVGRAFLFLNSIINPFLYVLSCKLYRDSMIEAFCGGRCRKTTSKPDGEELKVKAKANTTNEENQRVSVSATSDSNTKTTTLGRDSVPSNGV